MDRFSWCVLNSLPSPLSNLDIYLLLVIHSGIRYSVSSRFIMTVYDERPLSSFYDFACYKVERLEERSILCSLALKAERARMPALVMIVAT